ncbi:MULTISPECIES: hypothetical protein [Streptomyces]|uniref:DUF2933 domain-containing protein n=1 Tax=Streptomyces zinciresistens K42 TaxID=700597 RepID=G2G611_9ACTN|nr:MULTISPECIES: hypothetical protein [Streptomyces]EGX61100.1 hypothetical protein SZN_04586 [Streptomyces zinciresistens K42]MDT9696622.1 hypothetical protein [Streptomyces sp. P17]
MPQFLYPLLLLACPIGMGLMMWLMMRGGSHPSRRNESASTPTELDELRKEIAELRSAQATRKDTHETLQN